MKVLRESVTVCMSPDERDAIIKMLGVLHDHAESYVKAQREIDGDFPADDLITAMSDVYLLMQALKRPVGKYALCIDGKSCHLGRDRSATIAQRTIISGGAL